VHKALTRLQCDIASLYKLRPEFVRIASITEPSDLSSAASAALVSRGNETVNATTCEGYGWESRNPYAASSGRRLAAPAPGRRIAAAAAAAPAAAGGRRLVAAAPATPDVFSVVLRIVPRAADNDKFAAAAAAAGMTPADYLRFRLLASFSTHDLPSFYTYLTTPIGAGGDGTGLGLSAEQAQAVVAQTSPTAPRAPAFIVGLLVAAGALVVAIAGCVMFRDSETEGIKRT
jgi:hypothetical protein